MVAGDVAEASRIFRLAFGTFLRVPDVTQFRADNGMIETRFRTDPGAALVAECDGRVIGSAMGMDWGGQFVIGPVTVDPKFWGRGVARLLMPAILRVAEHRQSPLVTLFTFPHSPMHLRLYESFGFVPMLLTPIMSKATPQAQTPRGARLFSELSADDQRAALEGTTSVSERVLPGLDLRREIEAIQDQRLGETVLLETGSAIAGFALCHIGAGTEAGRDVLFVKFAAARPGAGSDFDRLLDAVEALAVARGVARITAGVNTGRRDAYRHLLARGFRAEFVGVAMHRPEGPGTLRPDVYVIDDWR